MMVDSIYPGNAGNESIVSDEQLISTLVDAGAAYVAVAEGSLPDHVFLLIDGRGPARDRCFELLEEITGIRINDDAVLPIRYNDSLVRTTHYRVPLYIADGHEELSPVDVDDGVENLRQAVEGDWNFTPPRDQTVPLEQAVEAFVDAGADSVTASREMLGHHETVDLCVSLPDETVYNIAGRYETVTFDGEEYRFHVEPLTIGGPQDEAMRIGLYYGENIAGIDPKSVEEGLDDVRSFLESDHIYPRSVDDD